VFSSAEKCVVPRYQDAEAARGQIEAGRFSMINMDAPDHTRLRRWATPVTAFQRTALMDTEVGGVSVRKGQRVVMFYRSANFDDEVFEDPFTFDIRRDPNPHVSFGGTGAHYCVGANLARLTIDLMFGAIAEHMPNLNSAAEPQRLRHGWLNGIKHWDVDYAGDDRPVGP
jgi:cholest-4-en-3-one 26-monooxygenase